MGKKISESIQHPRLKIRFLNIAPKISVILPVYNAQKYVSIAIESILTQSYKEFEFIIINDGSTDNSCDIIKSYDDDRIVFINQERKGLIYTLNHGIQKARSQYIARMDSDDISQPERLLIQLSFMKKHSNIGVLGTGCQFINSEGRLIGRKLSIIGEHSQILDNTLNARRGVSIIHPTAMIRKDVLLEAGGYHERFPVCEDVDLWLRIANTSKLHVIPDVLLLFRVHQENVSVTRRRIQLQSGILARVCFLLRSRGLPDPTLYQEDAWEEFKRVVNNTIASSNLYRSDSARLQLSSQLTREKGFIKYMKFLLFLTLHPHLVEGLIAKQKWNRAINNIVNNISQKCD
ncbi:MAG: glycosyltransferase [Nitrospirota bacterium]